jgi:hypothetical protein
MKIALNKELPHYVGKMGQCVSFGQGHKLSSVVPVQFNTTLHIDTYISKKENQIGLESMYDVLVVRPFIYCLASSFKL